MKKLSTIQAKEKLKLLGFNQTDFAKKIGVSANTVTTQFKPLYVNELYRLAILGLEFEQYRIKEGWGYED